MVEYGAGSRGRTRTRGGGLRAVQNLVLSSRIYPPLEDETVSRSIKPQWEEEKVIDIWNTKDSDLLARVGEVVGWKYLWRQGITTWNFWVVVRTDLFRKCMTPEQQNYLNEFRSGKRPARAWDLVGLYSRSGRPCLVEVKTTRSERYRYDSRKFSDTEQRLEAKSLGFKLLLVIVRLVGNWKFVVVSRELC